MPGKESKANQVPFRGRHNRPAGSPQFQSQIHVSSRNPFCSDGLFESQHRIPAHFVLASTNRACSDPVKLSPGHPFLQAISRDAKSATKGTSGLSLSVQVPVPSDHKSFPQTSPGRDGTIQSPARECRERKAKKTKSPLGDATTNLLVRLNSNLKSMFFCQQLELFREIHSAVMVFLIRNILPDGGHLRLADATGKISLLPFEARATVFLHPSR